MTVALDPGPALRRAGVAPQDRAPEETRLPVADDEALLTRVARGEAEAVRECLATYGSLVWSMARRRFGATADAEDAVQEVFIALWQAAGRFDPAKGKEVQFVSVIARRRLIDRLRRKTARPETASLEVEPPVESDDTVARDDEAARARQALDQLRPDQKRCIELSMGGLSHQQIAEHTGMPLGTVKTHVRRGLQRVRDLLADAGPVPGSGSDTMQGREVTP